MSYDSILKFLVEDSPEIFAHWLLKVDTNTEVKILNVELNLEPIRVDGLFFLTIANRILHLEFQTSPQSQPPIPLRMLDYWVRLYRQYNSKIEQVVIYLQPSSSEAVFLNEFREENTYHRYRVIRIWEENPEELLKYSALLPLAVLAKTNNPNNLLQQVASKVDTIEERREKVNVSTCVQLLAGIKFDLALINAYFREDIMQESVVYNSILEKGLQKGIQQGIQQGVQQGIQQGIQQIVDREKDFVLRLINRNFGEISPNLSEKIKQLSLDELENLTEALFDFKSESDLVNWLNSH
jgi:predicted transposase/invertase (TIGR01784 family)